MSGDQLTLRLEPLDGLALWSGNPKLHSLHELKQSIRQYGFKVVPRYEPSLNGGEGAIGAGNGRVLALRAMKDAGEPPPRGVLVDDDGRWMVPVLHGVDASTEGEAHAFGVDDNLLTLGGSGLGFEDLVQLFDEEALEALLRDTPDASELLVSLSASDLDALLSGPDFHPAPAEDQSRLDEKAPLTCPECGAEVPR
jgi:hypothetical protein